MSSPPVGGRSLVCVITLTRGNALWGRLWIGCVLFIWLADFLYWLAAGTTQRPRIPDVGFRGLKVTWSQWARPVASRSGGVQHP